MFRFEVRWADDREGAETNEVLVGTCLSDALERAGYGAGKLTLLEGFDVLGPVT